MANSWEPKVKASGKLTYFLQPSVTGEWANAIAAAVKEFQDLSKKYKLGVIFAASSEAPTESGGANVSIAVGSGAMTYSYEGTQTKTINGQGMSAYTRLIARENSPIEKAFMFLPLQPIISTPKQVRPVGVGVLRMIALHELIHACGLDDHDHTDSDVFNGHPSPEFGATPAQDKLLIVVNRKNLRMPPTIFSSATAAKILAQWK
jgi:hypothetical protein